MTEGPDIPMDDEDGEREENSCQEEEGKNDRPSNTAGHLAPQRRLMDDSDHESRLSPISCLDYSVSSTSLASSRLLFLPDAAVAVPTVSSLENSTSTDISSTKYPHPRSIDSDHERSFLHMSPEIARRKQGTPEHDEYHLMPRTDAQEQATSSPLRLVMGANDSSNAPLRAFHQHANVDDSSTESTDRRVTRSRTLSQFLDPPVGQEQERNVDPPSSWTPETERTRARQMQEELSKRNSEENDSSVNNTTDNNATARRQRGERNLPIFSCSLSRPMLQVFVDWWHHHETILLPFLLVLVVTLLLSIAILLLMWQENNLFVWQDSSSFDHHSGASTRTKSQREINQLHNPCCSSIPSQLSQKQASSSPATATQTKNSFSQEAQSIPLLHPQATRPILSCKRRPFSLSTRGTCFTKETKPTSCPAVAHPLEQSLLKDDTTSTTPPNSSPKPPSPIHSQDDTANTTASSTASSKVLPKGPFRKLHNLIARCWWRTSQVLSSVFLRAQKQTDKRQDNINQEMQEQPTNHCGCSETMKRNDADGTKCQTSSSVERDGTSNAVWDCCICSSRKHNQEDLTRGSVEEEWEECAPIHEELVQAQCDVCQESKQCMYLLTETFSIQKECCCTEDSLSRHTQTCASSCQTHSVSDFSLDNESSLCRCGGTISLQSKLTPSGSGSSRTIRKHIVKVLKVVGTVSGIVAGAAAVVASLVAAIVSATMVALVSIMGPILVAMTGMMVAIGVALVPVAIALLPFAMPFILLNFLRILLFGL